MEASFSAKALAPGISFAGFLDSLPEILGAKDLKAVARSIADAKRGGKTVILGMGAHVIKVGLTPVIIDLMEKGVINALAMNGACLVHDFEMAYQGKTSEDVDAEIGEGTFGMAEETGGYINAAIVKGVGEGLGLGASVGKAIAEGFTLTENGHFGSDWQGYEVSNFRRRACSRRPTGLKSRQWCMSPSGRILSTCIRRATARPQARAACGTSGHSAPWWRRWRAGCISTWAPPLSSRRRSLRP